MSPPSLGQDILRLALQMSRSGMIGASLPFTLSTADQKPTIPASNPVRGYCAPRKRRVPGEMKGVHPDKSRAIFPQPLHSRLPFVALPGRDLALEQGLQPGAPRRRRACRGITESAGVSRNHNDLLYRILLSLNLTVPKPGRHSRVAFGHSPSPPRCLQGKRPRPQCLLGCPAVRAEASWPGARPAPASCP